MPRMQHRKWASPCPAGHWLIFSIRAPAPFATPWLPFAPPTDSDARGAPGLRGSFSARFTSSVTVRYVERFNPVTRVPPWAVSG
jgi:hypothetical protein